MGGGRDGGEWGQAHILTLAWSLNSNSNTYLQELGMHTCTHPCMFSSPTPRTSGTLRRQGWDPLLNRPLLDKALS